MTCFGYKWKNLAKIPTLHLFSRLLNWVEVFALTFSVSFVSPVTLRTPGSRGLKVPYVFRSVLHYANCFTSPGIVVKQK